jgi:hypothetical protein
VFVKDVEMLIRFFLNNKVKNMSSQNHIVFIANAGGVSSGTFGAALGGAAGL